MSGVARSRPEPGGLLAVYYSRKQDSQYLAGFQSPSIFTIASALVVRFTPGFNT